MPRIAIRTGPHVDQLSCRHSLKAYAPLFPHHYLEAGIFESGEDDYATHLAALKLFSFCERFQLKPIANVGKHLGCDASKFCFPLAFSTPKGAVVVLDFPDINPPPVANGYWDELPGWDMRGLGYFFGLPDKYDARISARRGSGVDLEVIVNALTSPRE